jgi:glycosyltransferase involved in cell wall biosynthesis
VRVCLVNTFHYRRGGDCTYTLDLADLLRSKGHTVIHFAMKHPSNLPCEHSGFFADHIDFLEVFKSRNPVNRVRAFGRSLYSGSARRSFARLLDETRPDIVHLQNFRRHLTFSIVAAAKERGLPVVFTAHDYDPICPNSLLLADGRICTVCGGKHFYKAALVRCKEKSMAGSLAIALEGLFTRMRSYYDLIDVIVTPSAFARDRLVEYGFDAGKVKVVHNFIDADAYVPKYGGTGAVFFGRLAPEKGIDNLLRASIETPGVSVKVVGDGPERGRLEEMAGEFEVKPHGGSVEFLGYMEKHRLHEIVRQSMCVVMPSIWYENFPYAVLEAFALGKPVVASDIGGMPEMVQDGRTGLLVEPGNAHRLAVAINRLGAHPEEVLDMGRAARQRVEHEFDAGTHYDRIMEIYGPLAGTRSA